MAEDIIPVPVPTPPIPVPKPQYITGALVRDCVIMFLVVVTMFRGCQPTPTPSPGPAPIPAPLIALPESVSGPVGRAIPIDAVTTGAVVQWWTQDSADLVIRHSGDTKSAVFIAPLPGKYTVLAWTTVKGVSTPPAVCTVVVGAPVPPGPIPPGPDPSPPTPAPIRVLMLYESADKLTTVQQAILFSTDIRAYLDSHCLKEGTQPAWRVWDKSVDAKGESVEWQAVLAKSHPVMPCILIGNGKDGFEGPLPTDKAAAMELLRKWGGK